MSSESIQDMLRHRPFRPFQVRMSNGDAFEVRHAEFAILLKSNLIIGVPDSDRFAVCALLHIADLQRLQPV